MHTYEVRDRCRLESIRFGFSKNNFNRIPIHYFDYFRATDPFSSVNVPIMNQMEIITVFMIINQIDNGLMMAFYNAGGQNMNMLFRLANFFHRMWQIYHETSSQELFARFGMYYAYHLNSRTLRYINMTQYIALDCFHRRGNRFVPSSPHWERDRLLRYRIRNGSFVVNDYHDLERVHSALKEGLMRQGYGRR